MQLLNGNLSEAQESASVPVLNSQVTPAETPGIKSRYQILREAGRCPNCGVPVTDGYARCATCRQKHHAARARRKRTANAGLGGNPSTYARRKTDGLCARCGRVPATHGINCSACAAKNRAYQRRRSWGHANWLLLLLIGLTTKLAERGGYQIRVHRHRRHRRAVSSPELRRNSSAAGD